MALRTTGFALAGRRMAAALTPGHRIEPARQARTHLSNEPSRTRSRFSTLPFRQKDHPRSDQAGHSKPEDTAKTAPPSTRASIPTSHTPPQLSATKELSFKQRLQFLDGKGQPHKHLSASLITRSSNPTNDPTDPYTTAASESEQTDQHRATRKRRYRPAFQPGDFICPQCGSHNHRPPEHNMAYRLESKVLMKRDKSGSKLQSSSRIPTQGQRPSRYQARIEVPDRKFPLGAKDRCFECGFGTFQEIAPAQGASVAFDGIEDNIMSEEHEDRIRRGSSKDSDRGSSSSSTVSSDLRLSKPRDYVCPQCQTVNYNGRLYCVSCGTLALGILEFIERGSSCKIRQSVKSSSARTGRFSKRE